MAGGFRFDHRHENSSKVGTAHADCLASHLDLRRRIHDATGVECDLVILEDATLRLVHRILRDRIVVYDDDPISRVRYEARARGCAADFAIHADRLDRELLRATAQGPPVMVDAGRLRALLDRVAEELDALRRLAAMHDTELHADPERLPGAKYRLQVAVEACIDATEHIIASEGFRVPETFADAFTVLGEHRVIGDDLQAALEDAARLRSLLVHGYVTADDRRVIEILRTRLDDLDAFRRAVAAYGARE